MRLDAIARSAQQVPAKMLWIPRPPTAVGDTEDAKSLAGRVSRTWSGGKPGFLSVIRETCKKDIVHASRRSPDNAQDTA